NPDERYASALELYEALKSLAEGRSGEPGGSTVSTPKVRVDIFGNVIEIGGSEAPTLMGTGEFAALPASFGDDEPSTLSLDVPREVLELPEVQESTDLLRAASDRPAKAADDEPEAEPVGSSAPERDQSPAPAPRRAAPTEGR